MIPDIGFSVLTPTAFLERSARIHPERTAIVDGPDRFTYEQFHRRSLAVTGVLAELGVKPGDRVAVLAVNGHLMLEMHHGVPMRGAVLVPLSTRLPADELAWIIRHSAAKVLVASVEFEDVCEDVAGKTGIRVITSVEYERLVAAVDPEPVHCQDEHGILAVNYSGRGEGTRYAHRGAYLQALTMAVHTGLGAGDRYLWTLPMFHGNGWTFTWAVGAAGATHVCLRSFDAAQVWELLRTERITHYAGQPTVLAMIATAPQACRVERPVEVMTGDAVPSPALLRTMAGLGMEITHLYGLDDRRPEWEESWADELGEYRLRAVGSGEVTGRPGR